MFTKLAVVLATSGILSAQPECEPQKAFDTAQALLQQHQYEGAFTALSQLQNCRMPAQQQFQLGWLYGRARHFDAALKVFQATPADVPDRLTHGYAVALSEFELNNYGAAIETLKSLKANGAFDDRCQNLLGVAYSKAGRYQEAFQVFNDAIREHPDQLPGYLNLITLCVDGGNLPKAAEVAQEAAHAFPQSPEAYIVLGAANTLLGHLEKAHDSFEAAAKLAPTKADPRFFLALTDYKLDKLNNAVAELRSAQTAGIADSDLHYLLAECLLRLDGTAAGPALAELDQAIALNPQSVSARVLRGKLLLKAHKAAEALVDLQAAYQVDPQSRSAIYNLARAYQLTGKATEANRLFKEVQEQASDPLNELSNQRLNATLTDKASH